METSVGVCVIGGGASGMMAALSAARRGRALGVDIGRVLVLERNQTLGRKLAITGKGRANVTNVGSVEDFIHAFGPSGRFLYPAFESFFSDDLRDLFAEAGLELKTERGGRVFPATDDARDVVQALALLLSHERVDIHYLARVHEIRPAAGGWIIQTTTPELIRCGTVVLASGGKTYPGTGSTGDGYELLRRLGHSIGQLYPGLVPLRCTTEWLAGLDGVSLVGVALEVWVGGHLADRRQGEIMITAHGIGGPAVLAVSLVVGAALERGESVVLRLDLRPRQTFQQVREDIERAASSTAVLTYISKFTPKRVALQLMEAWGLDLHGKATLSKKTKDTIAVNVKGISMICTGTDPFSSAIITVGGVSLQEVDPRSMQSRIHPGLFVVGELLDVQAVTGGFNLQAAFSTGFLAGKCAAESVAKSLISSNIKELKR